MNQYETDRIADRFAARGFRVVATDAAADVYVVNSCSVTATAERKSRQMVRRLSRRSPAAAIVLTGCWPELEALRGGDLGGCVVVPNAEKLNALEYLLHARPGLDPGPACAVGEPAPRPAGRTRAVVKVQDGCDINCSYCSIPMTRPSPTARPAREVLDEVCDLAARGSREVVVTGVLTGAYGPAIGSGGDDLGDLLGRIAGVPGIERIRLSSIEPTQVTDRLLSIFAATPAVCSHLHIPLQSGADPVLRAMNRPYNRRTYLDLCARAVAAIPDLGITTDILVGFPGETREDFGQTMAVVREVGFARSHIFRFSARPMTPAASMSDVVDEGEKERRAAELSGLCAEMQRQFARRYVGRTMPVLVEGKRTREGFWTGYTPNYIQVQFAGEGLRPGAIAAVRLEAPSGDGLRGSALAV